jgi:steroid 5-alpha reductase family enzyme
LILLLMIAAWGLRLAGFLFVRILKQKKDKRFDGIRENFWKFLSFWVLQGVSVWLILLPAMLFMYQGTRVTFLTWLGFAVWLFGLHIEAIADMQKSNFKKDPKNKGRWIESGLWKYSRHPNYFGEMTCWTGAYLFTFSSLPVLFKLIGLASPLYIAILLLFVTGLPKLEAEADAKFGKMKGYREYKKRTSVIIPLPLKR